MCGESRTHGVNGGKIWRLYQRVTYPYTTVAQVAVIKKMIVIAHALYVNNCAYDAVFYKKQCGVNREIGVFRDC